MMNELIQSHKHLNIIINCLLNLHFLCNLDRFSIITNCSLNFLPSYVTHVCEACILYTPVFEFGKWYLVISNMGNFLVWGLEIWKNRCKVFYIQVTQIRIYKFGILGYIYIFFLIA